MKISARGKFLVKVNYLGNSQQPIIVIDDFIDNPLELMNYAASEITYRQTSQLYPGVRANTPVEYKNCLSELLSDLICEVFGWQSVAPINDSELSLVTKLPQDLLPAQRIPHFDFNDLNGLAVLHYLCRPEQGGTSFYRHRHTGYELVLASDADRYLHIVNTELQQFGMPPPRYIDGDTLQFQRIANYGALFNRVLIYRGALLHSGSIPNGFVPDLDPRKGRLTANTFINRQT